MKNKNILSIILAIVSIGLAVLAYIILPQNVIIQFSIGSSENSTVPKLIAVLIPAVIGVGGAVAMMLSNDDDKSTGKKLLVSIVGIGLCIFTIVVNSLIK